MQLRTAAVLMTLLCAALMHETALAQRGPAQPTGPSGFPPGPEFARHSFDRLGPPGGHSPPMAPPWAKRPEDLERVGLTDAQRAKVGALREATERTMIRVGAEVRIAELDLGKLIEQDSPDARAVEMAVERVGTLRLSMHKAMIAEVLGVRAALTADQRNRLRKRAAEPERNGRPGREREWKPR